MEVSNSTCARGETILLRLDRLDTRLSQLEEKQRLSFSESYFSTHLHPSQTLEPRQQCKPLASALQEVHFKGTLMDRLRVLESRILQLSYELDNGDQPNEMGLLLQHAKRDMFNSGTDRACCFHSLQQGQRLNLKAKDLKEECPVGGENKELKCRNNRACRRWRFTIGC